MVHGTCNIQNLNNKILQDIYGKFRYGNSVFECNENWSNFQNIVKNIKNDIFFF